MDALTQSGKLKLFETGALSLVFAHSISLCHCKWLFQAQKRQSHADDRDKFTQNSDISSFLGAVANAQRNEFFENGEMSITHA
ncbi:hypothetical protein [Ruegeria sp. THAF57]|uniref:hypothetical protein n=1 Tax=Ruegeria sp. THAF57 TaxID=2744555 RepID=UPI0015DD5EF0|nr:hypothetical protein [Ruegeria sp. THAF57]